MKNIKHFQSIICNEQQLKNHIDRLIQSNKEANDKLNIFFSGALSSFLTNVLTLIFENTIIWERSVIRIGVIVVAFLLFWLAIAKIPRSIVTFFEQRKKTTEIRKPDQQIIDYFNLSIVLSALEIKDAIEIIEDYTQEFNCRKASAILAASEYMKCIDFIIENIQKKHIRFVDDKIEKHKMQYINEYNASLVFEMLYKSGEALTAKKSIIRQIVSSELIISDLTETVDKFHEYRMQLGSNVFMYENK